MVDQPDPGPPRSYKIRGHTRRKRTTKPYARPSEVKKKSLLDTVKDYLSPSWLFGYLQSNEQDDFSDSEEDIDNENPVNDRVYAGNASEMPQSTTTLPSTTLEDDVDIVDEGATNLSLSTQVAEKNASDQSQAPSTLSENNNRREKLISSQAPTLGEIEKKEDKDEDNFKFMETVSESLKPNNLPYSIHQLKRKPLSSIFHSQTPSSSVYQPRGTRIVHGNSLLTLTSHSKTPAFITPAVPSFSSQNTSMSSVSSLTSSARRPQSVSSASSTPGFSVSTFVTPLARSFSKKRTESPFYPGVVTYGGALSRTSHSSSAKRQRRSSPNSELYQPARKQQIKAKPLPNATQRSSTSQTAQRILEALESVSSPLKDVGRIPSPIMSPSASPLSFSPSKVRTKPPRPKLGPRVSSLQNKFLGVPPVEALSTPQNAKIMSADNIRSSKTTKEVGLSKQATEPSFFAGLKDTVFKTSLPSEFMPKALPTSLSPGEKASKVSGKMRSTSRGATHYSSRNTVEIDQATNPLPEISHAVPLPVTNKNISSSIFTSGNKKESEQTKTSKPEEIFEKVPGESPKNGFIFTTPKSKPNLSVREVLSIADDEVSFSFSQPVPVKPVEKVNNDSKKDLPKNSPSVTSPNVSKASSVKLSDNVTKSPVKPLSDTLSNSLLVKFAPLPGQWKCSVCMIRNQAKDKKCIACETPNNEADNANKTTLDSSNIAKRFAPADGSWKCDTCLVRNDAASVKCAACSSLKPNSNKAEEENKLRAKFAPPANSWKCDVCMVTNNTGNDKCVACTALKPGTTSENLLKKFAPPANSWKCETCLVRNKESDLKCRACESKKPGSESGNDQSGFSFGASSASSSTSEKSTASSSAFKLGFTTGETKSGFTFGNNSKDTTGFGKSTVDGNEPGFKFAAASSATEDNKQTEFKFGSAGNGETKEKKDVGFKFGSGGTMEGGNGFKFGSSDGTKDEQEVKNSGFKFGTSTGSEIGVKPGFTFGTTSSTEVKTSTGGNSTNTGGVVGFKFGSDATASTAPGFTFAGTTSTTVTSGTIGIQFGVNSTTEPEGKSGAPSVGAGNESKGVMNIAEAASRGLLSVPTKTETTSTKKVSANEQQPSSSTFFTPTTSNGTTTFLSQNSLTASSSLPSNSVTTTKETPATSTAAPVTAKIPPFVFGAAVPVATISSTTNEKPVTESTNKITPFNFPSQSLGEKKDTKSLFTFGVVPDSTKETPVSVFKFGATVAKNEVVPVVTKADAAPPVFSFCAGASGGVSTTDNKTKFPPFNFGAVNGPSTNGPSGQTQTSSTSSTLFNFTATQPPVNENQNSLGGEEMEADSNNNHDNIAPMFAAGSSGGTTNSAFNFAAQTTGPTGGIFGAAGNAGGFSFGSGTAPAGTNTMPPNIQFATPINNTSTPSGAFNFSASAPAGSSSFLFGQGSTAANNPVPSLPSNSTGSSSFNFTAQPTTTNTPTQAFNFSQSTPAVTPISGQPAMFNVGAVQPTPPGSRVFKKAVRRRQPR